MSRKITQLEAAVGQPLLFRSTTSVSLTAHGDRLYRDVHTLIGQLSHSIQKLNQEEASLTATVRITAPEDFGSTVLAPLVARFSEAWPNVRIECLFTERVLDLVKESIDLAVRMGRAKGADMVARKIGDMTFEFVATPDYVRRAGVAITGTNIKDHVKVAFGLAGSSAPFRFNNIEEHIAFPARIWCKSFASIHKLALQGYGATFLPTFLVKQDIKDGRLVRVASGCAPESLPAYLVTIGRRISPAAAALMKFLQKELPDEM